MKLFLLLRAQSNTLNAKFPNAVTTVWWCTQQILKTTEQLPFPRRRTTLSTKRLTNKKIQSTIASERKNGSSMTKKYRTTQVRFQAIRLRGAISVIFGAQVSLPIHYWERDEVYLTTLLWQNNARKNGLIYRMLFSELYKIMVKKVTFAGFREGDRPNRPWIRPC